MKKKTGCCIRRGIRQKFILSFTRQNANTSKCMFEFTCANSTLHHPPFFNAQALYYFVPDSSMVLRLSMQIENLMRTSFQVVYPMLKKCPVKVYLANNSIRRLTKKIIIDTMVTIQINCGRVLRRNDLFKRMHDFSHRRE